MDAAKGKHGNDRRHRWNWKCWDRLLVVRTGDGIVTFFEKLIICYELFDDITKTCLQDGNLTAEMRTFSTMDKDNWTRYPLRNSAWMTS